MVSGKLKKLGLACLLVLPVYVSAQNKLDTIQSLREVVVVGSRIQTEIIPVQTLSGIQLEKLAAHSVADALRFFSGVQLKDYGGVGGLKTINIRSMGSQHVGVFYDGIEIGNPQNGVVDLGRFSVDNMEAISLYNGQKSAIFQSAKDFSTASSIYMVPKKPSFENNQKYSILGIFRTGSFNIVNPSVLWMQQLSETLSSSLNVEYMQTSGKYKFTYAKKNGYDTTVVRRNGDVEMFRVEHALFGKINRGEWRVRSYLYQSERGYPGALVKENPGEFKHQDRQWDTNIFVQSSFKKNITSLYSMLLNGKYAYDYLHYVSDPRLDVTTMYLDNKYKLKEVYLSSANMFNILPFWSTNISADFQWNKLNANLTEFIYPQRYTTWAAAATSLHFDRLKIQASMLATFIHETMREEREIRKSWDKYTPTIVASWQPWEHTDINFRAFYKKIFRMPTFSEIYFTFIGSGTSNLKPEYTTQYNIGTTYSKAFKNSALYRIEAQADAYYNEVTDKLLAKPGGQNFRWTMMNIGFVKIKGIEMSLMNYFRLGKEWKLDTRLNYTYQKAQDYSNPDEPATYKGQIAYIPWHSGSAILSVNYKTWDLNYSFIYVGDRYEESANIPVNKALAWYTHDLALSKSMNWKKSKIRLTAEVNNLFDQQYEVVMRYPMPGTNFKFIVAVTL